MIYPLEKRTTPHPRWGALSMSPSRPLGEWPPKLESDYILQVTRGTSMKQNESNVVSIDLPFESKTYISISFVDVGKWRRG
jgi:hypothetical protein